MNKVKKLIVLALVLASTGGNAQTLENKVINAAGNSKVVLNILLESNVGEVFIGEGESAGYLKISHGFLQPLLTTNGTTTNVPMPPPVPVDRAHYGIDNGGDSKLAGNIFLENTVGEWMTTARTGGNYMLTQGILQPFQQTVNVPLPVTGLTFTAKRMDAGSVRLSWKTLTEAGNKGFYIERKLEKAADFTQLKFVPSLALNGNSTTPLEYAETDANNFTGKTWYRLRQEDQAGKITYSTIELVNGIKGKPVTLTAWPVPAPGEFSIKMEGLAKDRLMVYDVSGRLQYETTLREGQAIKISHLAPGTYFLRLAGEPGMVHKVVVMGNNPVAY